MPLNKNIRKNQIVLYQGESTNYISFVEEGIVRAYSILSNDNELNVSLFGEGDYFPVGLVFSKAPVALFYYETMTDCRITTYTIEEFQQYIKSQTDELEDASRRYIGALLHINAIGQATAFEKVAQTLKFLALRFGEKGVSKSYTKINIKLTQHDIAKLCNVSRETASMEITKLKNKSVLIEKNKFYSINLGLLTKYIGEGPADGVEL
jgi:CRP-like cAMP-binding protein